MGPAAALNPSTTPPRNAVMGFPIAFPNECMIPLFSDVSTGAADLSSTTAYNLAVGRTYYTGMTKTQITCAGYGGFRVFAIGW
ncbi:gp53-like domain-containing protein [Escherichia coli]|uniref:gp53-like domain-containing protein n=1 Tax=Escherichia coli TaxID=562 RepID=UPI003D803FF6